MKSLLLPAASVLASASALLLGGCGDSNAGNGVNDVKAACEAQQQWTRKSDQSCITCRVSAISSPDCDCTRDEYRGLCHEQTAAKADEPDCSVDIESCIVSCKDDCGCVDACFESRTACKQRVAALEGCLTDVCNDTCK